MRNYLLELITRINTRDEKFTNSTETTRWKALREAETLTDPALFSILQEIIEGHEGKKKEKREIRDAAYFIFGRLMQKSFNQDACTFFLKRVEIETDKVVLCQMLDRVRSWRQEAGITIPASLDISPILTLAKSDDYEVCNAAVQALRACPRKESRDVCAYYLTLACYLSKQNNAELLAYTIYYTNLTMCDIGEPEDIPLLERLLKSSNPDIRSTAKSAIRSIKERNSV